MLEPAPALLRPEVLLAGRALLLSADELLVPVEELTPLLLLVAPTLETGLALLRPELLDRPVVEVVAPDSPPHGATVGDVVAPPLGVMVTPATLQFCGTCCSMISTKLICWLLLPVVLEVVPVPVVPDALLEAPTAPPDAAGAEAPTAAPLAATPELDAPVELVVVVDGPVAVAAWMSMNTTIWPLLATFMNVPAMAGEEELALVLLLPVAALLEPEVPVLLAPPLDAANEPVHWFWLSICW